MDIRMSDKWINYSYGSTQTKQQVGQCIVGTFWCMDEPQINMNSQYSPQPELWGNHHLPLYNIFCD
jgi:hypothetical protein